MVYINGLDEFLADYPGMSLQPTRNNQTGIHGQFRFKAEGAGKAVEDSFELEILLENAFPNAIPRLGKRLGRFQNTAIIMLTQMGRFALVPFYV